MKMCLMFLAVLEIWGVRTRGMNLSAHDPLTSISERLLFFTFFLILAGEILQTLSSEFLKPSSLS
jgi:hypothetical protein